MGSAFRRRNREVEEETAASGGFHYAFRVLECPVCKKQYRHDPGDGNDDEDDDEGPLIEDRCSHSARLVFCSTGCPICLEDTVDPPVVALRCGHVVWYELLPLLYSNY